MTHWWVQNWGAVFFWGWLIGLTWLRWGWRHRPKPSEDEILLEKLRVK